MNQMMRNASWAILAAACAASPARAQNTATLSELVVTAQKREQNLQDVPVVVTTLPQRQLQDAGVRDIKDLPKVLHEAWRHPSMLAARGYPAPVVDLAASRDAALAAWSALPG